MIRSNSVGATSPTVADHIGTGPLVCRDTLANCNRVDRTLYGELVDQRPQEYVNSPTKSMAPTIAIIERIVVQIAKVIHKGHTTHRTSL